MKTPEERAMLAVLELFGYKDIPDRREKIQIYHTAILESHEKAIREAVEECAKIADIDPNDPADDICQGCNVARRIREQGKEP